MLQDGGPLSRTPELKVCAMKTGVRYNYKLCHNYQLQTIIIPVPLNDATNKQLACPMHNCVLYRTAYYCMLKGLLLAYNIIHVVVLGFFRIGLWSKTVIIIRHIDFNLVFHTISLCTPVSSLEGATNLKQFVLFWSS